MSAKRSKAQRKEFYQNELSKHEQIKEKILAWFKYNHRNIKNFNGWKKFSLASTISDEDGAIYDSNQMPKFTCNMLEAYMSRIWGEFGKNSPDMSTKPINNKISANQVEIIDGYIRTVLTSSDYGHVQVNTLRDQMVGGMGAQEVCLKYVSPKTFDQEIEIIHVDDPTQVGFDPLAEESSKGDGAYCFRLYVKKKKELQKEYPDLNFDNVLCNSALTGNMTYDDFDWNWWQGREEIVRCYTFYEKQYEYIDLVEVVEDKSNPFVRKVMTRDEWNEIAKYAKANPHLFVSVPEIKNSRKSKICKIIRYKGCSDFLFPRENEAQEGYEDDKYGDCMPTTLLPIVFFDNNSVKIEGKQFIRPYYYHAIDQQRLLDYSASNIVNDLSNLRPTDLFIGNEALPAAEEWLRAYKEPDKSLGTYVYNTYDSKGVQNAPPFVQSRNQVSESALAVFQMSIKAIQGILGAYDAQSGNLNEADLSGEAIRNSVIQSNYASAPCIIKNMESVNQVAKVVASIIPNIWVTQRTIPVTNKKGEQEHVTVNDNTNPDSIIANSYDIHDLGVYVKGSVNFDAQKDKAFKYITLLMKESPTFAAFINEVGMPLLLDNIDIRNIKMITEELKKFIEAKQQKAAQQGQMPSPDMLKALNDEKQTMIQAHKVESDIELSKEKLMIEKVKVFGDLVNEQNNAMVQLRKAQSEDERTFAMTQMELANHNLEKFIKMNDHVMKVDKHFSDKREKLHEKMESKKQEQEEKKQEKSENNIDNDE